MRGFRFFPVVVLALLVAIGAIVTANGSLEQSERDDDEDDVSGVSASAFAPFMPLSPDQELHVVVEVEAFGGNDSAFDHWTYDVWQRWDDDGDRHESIVVSDPDNEFAAHIVSNGETRLLSWEPENVLDRFDAPLEYGVWRRLIGNLPVGAELPSGGDMAIRREGQHIVLNYAWVDQPAEKFDYVSRGEALVDADTHQIERITWRLDRPEQEPYPIRRFIFQEIEVLPAGSSPDGTYRLATSLRDRHTPSAATPTIIPSNAHLAESTYRTPDEVAAYALDMMERGEHWDIPSVREMLHAIDPVVSHVEQTWIYGQALWQVEMSGRFEIRECPVRQFPTPGTDIYDTADRSVVRFHADDGLATTIRLIWEDRLGEVTLTVNSASWVAPTPTR